MTEPAPHFDRGRTFTGWQPTDRAARDHCEKWVDRVERRMLAEVRRAKGYNRGRPKPVWDRAKFVHGLVAIDPAFPAAELADLFERAIRKARGNPSRFRLELDKLLG